MPTNAIADKKIWDHDDTTGTVILTVDPHRFGAGKYGALVAVRAPYLTTNETQIAVSRTDGWGWPLAIGLLAGVVGALWFLGLKGTSSQKLLVSWWWLVALILIAGGVGAWAAVTNYWGKDVWTFDDDWVATAKLAFAAASTGSLAGVLAAVWQAPPATGQGGRDGAAAATVKQQGAAGQGAQTEPTQ